MISESLSLKTVAAISGALAGLTVLIRLGRLLEALETMQAEVSGLRQDVKLLQHEVAKLQGQVE